MFLATLIFHGHTYRLWHQEHKTPSADNATVEMKAQGTPFMAPQNTTQPAHPQYSDQQQYQSQVYPAQQQQPTPAGYPHNPEAYGQQPAAYPPQQQQPVQYQNPAAQAQPQPQGYAAFPDPAHYQPQQPYSPQGTPAPGQQAYSPHGTPAPGQAYYPPQHPPQQ